MPGVLTEGSSVTCAHQGKAALTGSSKLTVGGKGVVLKAGVGQISDCITKDDSAHGLAPCKTATITGGEATKLFIGTDAVLLDSLSGTTSGMVGFTTPQPGLSATANQTKLTAT